MDAFLNGLIDISPGITIMDTPNRTDAWIDHALRSMRPASTGGVPDTTSEVHAARRLHTLLGLYPGHEFDTALARALVADLRGGLNAPGLLVEAGLLTDVPGREPHDQRLAIPAAVHTHARRALRHAIDSGVLTERDTRTAVRTMCDYFWVQAHLVDRMVTPYRRPIRYASAQPIPARSPFRDQQHALDWMEEHQHLLISLALLADAHDLPQTAAQLCDVLWPVLLHRKHDDVRTRSDWIGVRVAEKWLQRAAGTDAETLHEIARASAAMTKRLGRGLVRRGRHRAATIWLERSRSVYEAIRDEHGIADVGEALAQQHRHRADARLLLADATRDDAERVDHLTVAIEELRQARDGFADVLDRYRRLGADRNIALSLLNLGDTHLTVAQAQHEDIDHMAVAVRFLHLARTAFAALDEPDPYNAARVHQALGRAHLMGGYAGHAASELTLALRTFADFDNKAEMKRTVLLLADVAHLSGEPERERAFLISAQELHVVYGQRPDPVIQQRLEALRGSA